MTWSEAQSYCRQHYTDLATVSSEEDVAKLNDAVGSYREGHVWIGLYDDINNWRWSLQNKSYYGEGEAEFRMWASSEPSTYYIDEYLEKGKTWSEAQSYCRQNYTDLASIRNLTENEEIRGLINGYSWIGLFRDTWKWSDGSTMSFSKWDNQPNGGYAHCVASHLGKWHDYLCSNRFYFVCYRGKGKTRHTDSYPLPVFGSNLTDLKL
uniref:C-type lectin domain-containing protein n=1 Tax=Myripristis murdjan TaxID=586833 RepID=A0A667X6G2_9TELE